MTLEAVPCWRTAVRTTVTLDDELMADAQRVTGLTEKSAVIREALKALVAREASRRLARLGGTQPDLLYVPRRRRDEEEV